jgi:hypothetical protein
MASAPPMPIIFFFLKPSLAGAIAAATLRWR